MTQRLQIRADHASSAGVFPPECAAIAPRPENSCQTDGSFYMTWEELTDGERTPIDEFSGLPLPISPAYLEDWANRYEPNENHTWHGQCDEPLLRGVGGEALQGSRVQLTNYDAHELYHDNFIGPKLPKNDDERLRPIVLAAAGYVPDRAIAFTKAGAPYFVRLSKETRERMWAEGHIRVASPNKVRAFLCDYLLDQNLTESIGAWEVDQFLNTVNPGWRLNLGNGFLTKVARHALGPISPVYSEAYEKELIRPTHARTVWKFVARAVLNNEYYMQAHEKLRTRLEAA